MQPLAVGIPIARVPARGGCGIRTKLLLIGIIALKLCILKSGLGYRRKQISLSATYQERREEANHRRARFSTLATPLVGPRVHAARSSPPDSDPVIPAHPGNCFTAGGGRCGCRRRRSQVAATPDQVCRTIDVPPETSASSSESAITHIGARDLHRFREPAPRESATEGDPFAHCPWPAQLA